MDRKYGLFAPKWINKNGNIGKSIKFTPKVYWKRVCVRVCVYIFSYSVVFYDFYRFFKLCCSPRIVYIFDLRLSFTQIWFVFFLCMYISLLSSQSLYVHFVFAALDAHTHSHTHRQLERNAEHIILYAPKKKINLTCYMINYFVKWQNHVLTYVFNSH